jgi:hypothetical protein
MGERLSTLTRDLDQARRELAERRQELDAAHGVSAAALHELVRGLHAVDESDSLTVVFERLIESARRHSNGAVVYLVRNEDLTEWESAAVERHSPRPEAVSVASNAARERRRVESESALAFPLSVGGEVVAVLYAEVADALSPHRRMSKDALDVLTRHAGRVLETITIQQATGLRPVRKETRVGLSDSRGERLS